ncbi:MAG TPA: hypothetical protein VH349_03550 [Ktedonobacterales bacterium]
MTTILADHNVEGHAGLLLATIAALGLAELLDLCLAALAEVGLAANSSDREVWRRAQELDMLLLTANRRKREQDSLEQTLREELSPSSLPVLTFGDSKRFLSDRDYRSQCAERAAEILFDLEQYHGVPRLYIP